MRNLDRGREIAAAAVAVLVLAGCEGRVLLPPNGVTPTAVSDLAAIAVSDTSATLIWTVPAAGSAADSAIFYDLRRATAPITPESWAAAARVSSPPIPRPPGGHDSLAVSGLTPETMHYFALRCGDESGEWSDLSNEASARTDPARTSPEAIIRFFAGTQADSVRDAEKLATSLHEEVRFYFTVMDQAEDPTIPESWPKDDLVAAMQNMFDHAVHISAAFTPLQLLGTEACDPSHPEILCQIHEVRVYLAVEVPLQPGQQDPTTYLVYGLANFTVMEDPAAPGRWIIRAIRDRTNELGGREEGSAHPWPATEHISWGFVLALYD